jgi:outer membrane protein
MAYLPLQLSATAGFKRNIAGLYSKTSTQIVQPNGTILFQPIHNDNSSLAMNFSQSLTATGGTVYGTTQLQRFDDFDRHNVYIMVFLMAIGYSQPLFQFNVCAGIKR